MTLHVEKYERIFLYLTVAVLVAAFAAVVATAVGSNIHLPDKSATILPEDIDATPPFDAPGLYQVGENEYQAVIIAQVFANSWKPMASEVFSRDTASRRVR